MTDRAGRRLNVAIGGAVVVLAVLVGLVVLGGDDGGGPDSAAATSTTGSTGATVGASTTAAVASSVASDTTAATAGPAPFADAVADPSVTGEEVQPVLSTFSLYVAAINAGNYASAYSQLGPGQQARQSFDDFVAGIETTAISDFTLRALTVDGSTAVARVTFRSTQDAAHGFDGQTCSSWELDDDLVLGDDGVWRIDRGRNRPGSPAAC